MLDVRGAKQRLSRIVTAFGIQTKGFFVPYGHVSSVPRTVPTYGAVEERFDALRPQLVEMIRAMGTHQSEIERAIGLCTRGVQT
ncbi:MAG: hypothetical protein AAF679_13310 [Pseudomonadota bacterium]